MLTRSLHISLLLATLLTVVGFALQGIRAIQGPANPEPIERLIASQALRIAHHDPPSIAADLSILPGLPMLVAPLDRLTGGRPWSARAISLVAILLTVACVIAIVGFETRHATLAVASGGLALAGFISLAGQPGEARTEPLMMAFVLAGFLAIRRGKNTWATLSAGFLLATSCLVDVDAVWFVAAALLALAIEDRKRLLVFALGVGLTSALGYAISVTLAGPWLTPHALRAALDSFALAPGPLLQYVGNQVLGTLGVLTLTALLSLALPTRTVRGPGGIWMHMGVAAVLAGMVATQRQGFGPQAMIPTVAALAVVGPISAHRLTQHLAAWPGSTRLGGQGVLLMAMALQFFMLFSCVVQIGDPRF